LYKQFSLFRTWKIFPRFWSWGLLNNFPHSSLKKKIFLSTNFFLKCTKILHVLCSHPSLPLMIKRTERKFVLDERNFLLLHNYFCQTEHSGNKERGRQPIGYCEWACMFVYMQECSSTCTFMEESHTWNMSCTAGHNPHTSIPTQEPNACSHSKSGYRSALYFLQLMAADP
jgi:hypothetical protein